MDWLAKDTPFLTQLLGTIAVIREDDDTVRATPSSHTSEVLAKEIEAGLQAEIALLVDEFQGVFSPESIDRLARDSLAIVMSTSLRSYLAEIAGRFAHERLKALAKAEGVATRDEPDVLFVCGRNAARSQMAAALAHQLSSRRISVHSAGPQPAARIDGAVMAVMAEAGIDLVDAFPKPLTDEVVQAADVVITMGCGDVFPLQPGKRYEDWPIEDPDGKSIVRVREIRDEIRDCVQGLVTSLAESRSR